MCNVVNTRCTFFFFFRLQEFIPVSNPNDASTACDTAFQWILINQCKASDLPDPATTGINNHLMFYWFCLIKVQLVTVVAWGIRAVALLSSGFACKRTITFYCCFWVWSPVSVPAQSFVIQLEFVGWCEEQKPLSAGWKQIWTRSADAAARESSRSRSVRHRIVLQHSDSCVCSKRDDHGEWQPITTPWQQEPGVTSD